MQVSLSGVTTDTLHNPCTDKGKERSYHKFVKLATVSASLHVDQNDLALQSSYTNDCVFPT